jgi:2-C-methyl-D-erythritol 2,4-cyclodiphosphate synthase
MNYRIGHGYDSHRLVEDRRLVLGGVEIPFEKGLMGHSDADVLCHSIIDALIGALGLGDIGVHFPDTDPAWKGADSIYMLGQIVKKAADMGLEVAWLDTTVLAEQPRIAPYIDRMKESLSSTGISQERINIKAKTAEGMGPVGRGEGMAAYAVCLIERST